MKLSDYIINFLVEKGVDTAFVFTGGAIAHVIDSAGKNDGIKYICVQHEQVGAIAAEAYSRTSEKMGVAMATSGPGATNMITGIVGAWYDNIPAIYLTGQVRTWELTGIDNLLQRGFQEVDIVSMVKSVTKYATTILKKGDIRCELEKAYYLATSGRPGPVLLDLPMDIQFSDINPEELGSFSHPSEDNEQIINSDILSMVSESFENTKSPVVIGGGGIRHARAVKEFVEFVERLNIPVVFSYAGIDLLPSDHPSNCGVMGQFGQQAANVIVQNADLVIALGTRFNIRQAGNKTENFAKNAKIISVNIDPGELEDGRVQADLSVQMDIGKFLSYIKGSPLEVANEYFTKCKEIKAQNPIVTLRHEKSDFVNPYVFIDTLSQKVDDNAIVIPDAGQNLIVSAQAFKNRGTQRFFSSWANSPMGYSFPAAIGAQVGSPDKQVVCIIGDGGIQVNIQDLQTVSHLQLPIKIFIINNQVYGAIVEYQDAELDKRYEATDSEHGYTLPNYKEIMSAYGINYFRINHHSEMNIIDTVLNQSGPVVCEVMVDPEFRINSPEQKPDNPLSGDSF